MTKQNTKVEFHIKCKMILKQKNENFVRKLFPQKTLVLALNVMDMNV